MGGQASRRADDVALRQRGSNRGRRDTGELRHDDNLEVESLEEREVTGAANAEAEVFAGDDRLDPDRSQVALRELLGRELLELGRERGDDDRRDAGFLQELESSVELVRSSALLPTRCVGVGRR